MALPINIPANTVKTFSEDTRVKIPALLHLTRLGYTYLSLKNATWDEATNIFPELFHSSIAAINPDATADARISQNAQLLTNPAYAEKMMDRLIIEQLKNNHQLPLTAEGCRFINNLIIKEYLTESQGQQPA